MIRESVVMRYLHLWSIRSLHQMLLTYLIGECGGFQCRTVLSWVCRARWTQGKLRELYLQQHLQHGEGEELQNCA